MVAEKGHPPPPAMPPLNKAMPRAAKGRRHISPPAVKGRRHISSPAVKGRRL